MDPIANMLTQIKNASVLGHPGVTIPFSGLKLKLAETLKRGGYVREVKQIQKDERPAIEITLKYSDGQPAISDIKQISKPGRRVYVSKNKIPLVRQGFGLAIISTSAGLMTDKEAREKKIGGEVLCEVW